jgi:uncharacterized protein involved in cysteine biosynthesis
MMKKALNSKKFWASVIGVIVVVITNFIPEIDETALTEIVTLIVAYIVGQGLADFGKEAK